MTEIVNGLRSRFQDVRYRSSTTLLARAKEEVEALERRLATIPFFNTVDIPFLVVSWNVFLDGAKTWDRNHVFQPSKLLLDAGGGLRFETPTHSLNLVYGRSLREGRNVFFAYFQRRLW